MSASFPPAQKSADPAGTTPTRIVRCPQCGGDSLWAASNRFRPFCSERCKMIDLGAWASESYRVPVQESAAPLADEAND